MMQHTYTPPRTAQAVHETLYDGADLPVTLKDGSARTVKVRKISRQDFPAFAAKWGSEDGEAEFYLGSAELVEQLSDESFDAVMQEGRRLNFTRFSNWFARQYQQLTVIQGNGAMDAAIDLIAKTPSLQKLLESTKS